MMMMTPSFILQVVAVPSVDSLVDSLDLLTLGLAPSVAMMTLDLASLDPTRDAALTEMLVAMERGSYPGLMYVTFSSLVLKI
jgi:hypothetical protein